MTTQLNSTGSYSPFLLFVHLRFHHFICSSCQNDAVSLHWFHVCQLYEPVSFLGLYIAYHTECECFWLRMPSLFSMDKCSLLLIFSSSSSYKVIVQMFIHYYCNPLYRSHLQWCWVTYGLMWPCYAVQHNILFLLHCLTHLLFVEKCMKNIFLNKNQKR